MGTKRVLVTGGAGFIGANLCRVLAERGYSVVALDDLSGGFRDHVPAGCEFIEASILDYPRMREVFAEGRFDYVYHLAAYAAEGLSHFIRVYNYSVNLTAVAHLINLSVEHKIKRFVFTSSVAVYGHGQNPMVESATPRPEDPYGIAKYAVELDLFSARTLFGLEYTIFRPHNVYGELQNLGDPYRNVIGIFMRQIMAGQALTVFGDGTQTRAFSYVSDVVGPMADCLEMPETIGEVYNVGADKAYTVNELARAVMKVMGKEVPIQYLPAREEVLHVYCDHSKVTNTFRKMPPSVTLEEGLERMAAWAKKTGVRESRLGFEIELWQNMPPVWHERLRARPGRGE